MSLTSPALAGGFFTAAPPGNPHYFTEVDLIQEIILCFEIFIWNSLNLRLFLVDIKNLQEKATRHMTFLINSYLF